MVDELLMIVFHRAVASRGKNFRQVTECLFKAVIYLYDGIELLGVILDENECSLGISSNFENTLISYLWLQIVIAVDWADSFDENRFILRTDEPLWKIYYVIQAVFEAIFLGLCLGLSLGYGIFASILIHQQEYLSVHCPHTTNIRFVLWH